MPDLNPDVAQKLSHFPDPILAAIANAVIPDLGSGPADSELATAIENCLDGTWSGAADFKGSLWESGLWLLAGDLDRSHEISQANHSAEGSFWHGIMHRREGDFGNAKYWFRKVGPHPLFEQLAESTDGLYADPFEFVDECSRAVHGGGPPAERCRAAQWIEWQGLMVARLSGS